MDRAPATRETQRGTCPDSSNCLTEGKATKQMSNKSSAPSIGADRTPKKAGVPASPVQDAPAPTTGKELPCPLLREGQEPTAVTPPRPSHPTRPGLHLSTASPEMSARAAQRRYLLDARLTVLVTTLIYRPVQRVLALAHTSPTEVGEVPSRATGQHD